MADKETTAANSHRAVLETAVPLSQSLIWRLQADYYSQRGLKAWTEDQVPSYITNNPLIAERYARIVAAFLDDCLHDHASAISPENPLRILELGAGVGKFSYLFLRNLMPLLRERNLAPQTVRYSMTDCSEELLAWWRGNPHLSEFAAAGVLEFELLRAGNEAAQPKPARAPLVVIANYVFDSLPQDAFVIQNGQISEALVTTSVPGSTGSAASLNNVELSFANAPVSPQRYPDVPWNGVLEAYRQRVAEATLFFPSTALGLLQQLSRWSNGRMLLLAGDKGFAHEEELTLTRGTPALEFHGSRHCFSTMVNFDAIGRSFTAAGGLALLPPKHFTNLNICAFIMRKPEDEFPRTRKIYSRSLEEFGPDDLFTLMDWLNPYLESVSVAQALSILRLARWDTTAFLRLFPVLAPKLRDVSAERRDLREAVLRVWANRYSVEPADNTLPFACGAVLLELRFYIEAAAMFESSEQLLGRTAATSYNLGLCALGLEDRAAALAHMKEACRLDPAFEPARRSRERLDGEIKSS